MWQYKHTEELYHYGVKGMKWGVRQQKQLAKTIQKLDYGDTSKYKSNTMFKTASKELSDKHKKWMDLEDKLDKERGEDYSPFSDPKYIDKAKKEVDKWWNESENGPKNLNNRQYEKALEYTIDGLYKPSDLEIKRDKALSDYTNACRAATEKLVGKYGSMKLNRMYKVTYTRHTVNDYVNRVLSEIVWDNYKLNK